jgi:hypothetical protein
MPNSKHLTHGISNLVSLITKTKLGLSHIAKNDISLEGVRSENQLADIFTKPLDEATFCRLRSELNVLDSSNFKK